jgi:hypothetical protein
MVSRSADFKGVVLKCCRRYILKVDEHVGVLFVEDGPDSNDNLEFVLVVGGLLAFGGTSALHEYGR